MRLINKIIINFLKKNNKKIYKMKSEEENNTPFITYEERNTISFLLLSFYCGLSYISDLSKNYYLKENLHIEPSTMTLILAINKIPWTLNFFYACLIDFFPICTFSRKIYILLCGIINCSVWLFLSFSKEDNLYITILCFFFSEVTNSFCSVLGQSIILELFSNINYNSHLHSYNIMINDIGILIACYFQGLLVYYFPVKTVFFITSFLPILVIISGLLVTENSKKYSSIISFDDPNITVSQYMFRKKIIIPLIIIFIVFSSPNFYETFFYFSVDVLKFTPNDFGLIAVCKTITSLAIIFLYNSISNVQKYTKWIIIFGRILYLFFSKLHYFLYKRINLKYGINDFYSMLIITSIQYAIGQCLKIPVLNIATLVSHKNFGEMVYTTFVFIMNLGFTFSSFYCSGLTLYFGITQNNYLYLGNMIDKCIIFGFIFLIPLIFTPSIYLNPIKKQKKVKQEENIYQNELQEFAREESPTD